MLLPPPVKTTTVFSLMLSVTLIWSSTLKGVVFSAPVVSKPVMVVPVMTGAFVSMLRVGNVKPLAISPKFPTASEKLLALNWMPAPLALAKLAVGVNKTVRVSPLPNKD